MIASSPYVYLRNPYLSISINTVTVQASLIEIICITVSFPQRVFDPTRLPMYM
jgi:hypothetical protein